MNWKKFLSSLITVSLVLCIINYSVFADREYDGMCGDNAYYRYSDSDNDGVNDTVTIWGTGKIKDYECNLLGDRNPFHNEYGIENIIIEEGITAIGESAFDGCFYVLTVTVPDSVTSIGAYAFYDCPFLQSINIPNSVTSIGEFAFTDCSRLQSIDIPDSVTSIGKFAFSDCTHLQAIDIPNSVTFIGEYAFGGDDRYIIHVDGNHECLNQLVDMYGDRVVINGFTPNPTVTPTPVPTVAPTATPVPTVAPTATPAPTVAPTATPAPTVAPTATPVPTVAPTATPVPTVAPTATPVPTVVPTATPVPTVAPTATPVPTVAPTTTPAPTVAPTATPVPTVAPTATPVPTVAPTPTPESGVSGFVERLYTIALARSSDERGKADWVNRIYIDGLTGADVAKGFLFSNEFMNKDMSNLEFISILYRVFFDREGDQGGIEYWLGQMSNGMDKAAVIMGFINSNEWANVCLKYGIQSGGSGAPTITVEPSEEVIAFATRLYTTCLGRNADARGLNDWASRIANRQVSGSNAAYGFFFSSEFVNNTSIDDAEYINRLYLTIMGRPADEGGFNYWMERMRNGATRLDVFRGFTGSQEWARICASYGILK